MFPFSFTLCAPLRELSVCCQFFHLLFLFQNYSQIRREYVRGFDQPAIDRLIGA